MCLKITSTKKRNCRKAYKIVSLSKWNKGLYSIYQNYQFVHLRAWQFESRRIYLTGVEENYKTINDGYHLCPNLKLAKKTLNNLPGGPNPRDGYAIYLCEVNAKGFVARGTFELEKHTIELKGSNPQAESVVYNTFRFIKCVYKKTI